MDSVVLFSSRQNFMILCHHRDDVARTSKAAGKGCLLLLTDDSTARASCVTPAQEALSEVEQAIVMCGTRVVTAMPLILLPASKNLSPVANLTRHPPLFIDRDLRSRALLCLKI